MITRKEGKKEKVKHEEKKTPNYILKEFAHPLFDAWSLVLVHVQLHVVKGPRTLKFASFINLTMEKCHLTWDNFVVHNVNNPLLWKHAKFSSSCEIHQVYIYISIHYEDFDTGWVHNITHRWRLAHCFHYQILLTCSTTYLRYLVSMSCGFVHLSWRFVHLSQNYFEVSQY